MIIAQKLRKENIVEYLLYMWQIEDIIRANNLDIEKIKKSIIDQYDQPESKKKEILEWYESLIEMMREENITDKGHLIINKNTEKLLSDLHNDLLKSTKQTDYSAMFYKTLPFIVELRSKGDKNISEVETCLTALYAYLIMRIKKQEISKETKQALSQITDLMKMLSIKFSEDENDKLEL